MQNLDFNILWNQWLNDLKLKKNNIQLNSTTQHNKRKKNEKSKFFVAID